MRFLVPNLKSTINIEAPRSAADTEALLDQHTLWLDAEPKFSFQRVGYSRTWLLLPDLPETDRALYGHREGQSVKLYRVPGSWLSSLWPSGRLSVEARSDGCQVAVEFEAHPRAIRIARLTSLAFLLVGSVVGGVLGPASLQDNPLGWLGLLIGPIGVGLNRAMAGFWFNREVSAFREALQPLADGL
ncbi:MAG: hypothetical protein ACI9U2_003060 [Bradymonadia bacterium]|jgi:hypothetical protein